MAAKIGIRKLRLAYIIRRERVQLANLSEEQLRDIGINRATADSESRKAKFDIPRSRQIEAGLLDTGTRE